MANVRNTQIAVTLRPGKPTDSSACSRICFEAFEAIARQHNFPPDFPSVDAATGLITTFLSHPGFFSVVAETDGEVVGSNFLDERSPIAPIAMGIAIDLADPVRPPARVPMPKAAIEDHEFLEAGEQSCSRSRPGLAECHQRVAVHGQCTVQVVRTFVRRQASKRMQPYRQHWDG